MSNRRVITKYLIRTADKKTKRRPYGLADRGRSLRLPDEWGDGALMSDAGASWRWKALLIGGT